MQNMHLLYSHLDIHRLHHGIQACIWHFYHMQQSCMPQCKFQIGIFVSSHSPSLMSIQVLPQL
jgi:hypothetical protein